MNCPNGCGGELEFPMPQRGICSKCFTLFKFKVHEHPSGGYSEYVPVNTLSGIEGWIKEVNGYRTKLIEENKIKERVKEWIKTGK